MSLEDDCRIAYEMAQQLGSKAAASKELGIPISTLKSRIARYEAMGKPGQAKPPPAAEQAQRVRELEKLVAQQAERIENLHASKFKIPKAPKVKSGDGVFTRIIIPDTHGCFVDEAALAAFLRDLESLAPNVKQIVWLGDHLDCGGFLAQHHTMGYVAEAAYTFEDDADATNQLLDKVQELCPKAEHHYLEGNHECLTPDHDVLTRRGWVPIADVTTDDVVACMDDKGCTQWSNPLAVHKYQYKGNLIETDGVYWRTRMTPQHRIWFWNQSGSELCCRKAWKIHETTSVYTIPTAAINTQPELDGFTDDEIRLTAWMLTDGSLSSGLCVIYQSKEKYVEEIRCLLQRMGLKFSELTRNRGNYKTQHSFQILAADRPAIGKLFGFTRRPTKDDKKLPSWVHQLSARQFDIFLQTLIDGDGNLRESAGSWAACLYGEKEFLEQVQALAVVNGKSCSFRKKYVRESEHNFSNSGHFYCLNLCNRDRRKLQANTHARPYEGDVHCLTTAYDNFIIRHRGNVSVTGNSRIEKWCVTQTLRNQADSAYLLKLFSVESVLHLKKRGFNLYKQGIRYHGLSIPATIKLDHCHFTHGSRTGKHAAAAMLSDFGGNVVYGHTHRMDSYASRTVSDGSIGAWCPGALCRLQPMWMHTQPTTWTHGYGLQTVDPGKGFLHVNVPIIDGTSYMIQFTEL